MDSTLLFVLCLVSHWRNYESGIIKGNKNSSLVLTLIDCILASFFKQSEHSKIMNKSKIILRSFPSTTYYYILDVLLILLCPFKNIPV